MIKTVTVNLCFTDIAETSVEQCKERYDNLKKGQRGGYRESRERLFTLECLAADCTKVTSHQDKTQVPAGSESMRKPSNFMIISQIHHPITSPLSFPFA